MKLKNIRLDVLLLILVFFSIFFQKNIFLLPRDIYIKYKQTKKLEEIDNKYVKDINYNLDIDLKSELNSYNYDFLSKLIELKEEIIRTKYIENIKVMDNKLNFLEFRDLATLDDVLNEGELNEPIKLYLKEDNYLSYQDFIKKIYYNLILIREDKKISKEEGLYLDKSLNIISNTIKKDYELQKKLIDIANDMDYREINRYDLSKKNNKLMARIEAKSYYERYKKLYDFLDEQIKSKDYLFVLNNSKEIILDNIDKKDEEKGNKKNYYTEAEENKTNYYINDENYRKKDNKEYSKNEVDNILIIKKLFKKLNLKELKDDEIDIIEENSSYNISYFGSVDIYDDNIMLRFLNIKENNIDAKALLKSINELNYFVSGINTNKKINFKDLFEFDNSYKMWGSSKYFNIDYIKKSKNYFDEDNKLELEFRFDEDLKNNEIDSIVLIVRNKDKFFKEYDNSYEEKINKDIKIIKKELKNLELLNIMPVKTNEEFRYEINARGIDKEEFNIEIDIKDLQIKNKEVDI
ncbi:hypothetical protein WG909_04835 [Peptostreptococcaceae bacterium AGR-M142]